MAEVIILYILAVMIFYDFSLHLIELLVGKERGRKLYPYWPLFRNSKGQLDRKKYTNFWTAYWGIAFILVLTYILTL